jgi:hypothetical protein
LKIPPAGTTTMWRAVLGCLEPDVAARVRRQALDELGVILSGHGAGAQDRAWLGGEAEPLEREGGACGFAGHRYHARRRARGRAVLPGAA